MKRRFTIFVATLAVMLFSQAQTLTLSTGGNDGAVILKNGKFNSKGSFIGNTGTGTVIQAGEVDFGAGDYKAVSIRYANGWADGGVAIVKVGDDAETATEVARIGLINWGSYTNFRSIGGNMSSVPTGVKKVFITFEDRAGNIRDVRFYTESFTDDSFESGSMLKEPYQMDGYAAQATILNVMDAQVVVKTGEDTPRLDGDSWGWTGEGAVVKYGNLNFGNGDFKQVVLELASHYQGDQTDHSVDVYIDDYTDEANLIANVWCGIDVAHRLYLARNIPAISGTHTVYLKWHGGSCNISNVHFVRDYLYSLGNIYYPCDETMVEGEQIVVHDISDDAARYSFRDETKNSSSATYVGRDSGRTRILNKGSWEGDNVGWTGTGTVLRVSNVNFGTGGYNDLVAQYSTASWDASLPTNFKFYLDTEINKIDFKSIVSELTGFSSTLVGLLTGGRSLNELLDDDSVLELINGLSEEQRNTILAEQMQKLTPVATVKMKPTGDWGVHATTCGDLSRVTGTHTVYILYTANGNDGANLKDFWLNTYVDSDPEVVVPEPEYTLAQLKQSGSNGTEYKIADGDLTCVTTYKDGNDILLVCKDANAAALQLPASGELDFMGRSYFNIPATDYDHSNWVVLRTSESIARILKGNVLKNVRGTLANSANELTLTDALPYYIDLGELYAPNTYIPASFGGTQYSTTDGITYFFTSPKVNEYVHVQWAMWDGSKFDSPENSSNLGGSFAADLELVDATVLEVGQIYELNGLVTAGNVPAGAPRHAPADADYRVKVTNVKVDNLVVTGITDLNATDRVNTAPAGMTDVIYDLSGRRVVNPTAGIYIVNGKKMVVRVN